jgi:hypothetical protein
MGDVPIARDVFSIWLQDPLALDMLEEVDIGTSTKPELFDVLGVDMWGWAELR